MAGHGTPLDRRRRHPRPLEDRLTHEDIEGLPGGGLQNRRQQHVSEGRVAVIGAGRELERVVDEVRQRVPRTRAVRIADAVPLTLAVVAYAGAVRKDLAHRHHANMPRQLGQVPRDRRIEVELAGLRKHHRGRGPDRFRAAVDSVPRPRRRSPPCLDLGQTRRTRVNDATAGAHRTGVSR